MENTTVKNGDKTELEVETVSSSVTEPELSDVPEELLEVDEDEDAQEAAGSGVVSGAFGLASLAFALVSLTGGWLATAYQQRGTLAKTKVSLTSLKQEYDVYSTQWHTQAVFGAIFSLAALLIGAGVLASPSLLLSGKTPAWARAAALAGVIVGAVGLLLAVLTWFGLLASQLSAT